MFSAYSYCHFFVFPPARETSKLSRKNCYVRSWWVTVEHPQVLCFGANRLECANRPEAMTSELKGIVVFDWFSSQGNHCTRWQIHPVVVDPRVLTTQDLCPMLTIGTDCIYPEFRRQRVYTVKEAKATLPILRELLCTCSMSDIRPIPEHRTW